MPQNLLNMWGLTALFWLQKMIRVMWPADQPRRDARIRHVSMDDRSPTSLQVVYFPNSSQKLIHFQKKYWCLWLCFQEFWCGIYLWSTGAQRTIWTGGGIVTTSSSSLPRMKAPSHLLDTDYGSRNFPSVGSSFLVSLFLETSTLSEHLFVSDWLDINLSLHLYSGNQRAAFQF